MATRYRLGLIAGLLTLLVFPLGDSVASPTGYEVAHEFRSYYEQSGGIPVFGYALANPVQEDGRLVQYFERQRLELHPENAGTPYEVLLGHVGRQDAERRGLLDHEAFQPRAGGSSTSDSDYFPQTGHNLSNGFRDYWHSHGLNFGDPGVSFRESLALFGYPISEEFADPDTGLVTQYFERARFEFHPEHAGTEHAVLLGHLGNAEFQRANGNGSEQAHKSNPDDGSSEPSATAPPQESEPDSPPIQSPPSSSNPRPNTSIQQLVDRAVPGAVVHVPAGIYRETVTITKPLTLIGEPGAEIRGSDVWTDWSPSGGHWVSRNAVPEFRNNHGRCSSSTGESCKLQEQVFVDGQKLTRVSSSPGSGQFAVNNNRQIVLGNDPNGRTVEVSTRSYWVRGEAGNVTVEGFTMKHAANRAQTGAINNGGYDNWTIRGNSLSYAHGANVSVYGGNNLRLVDNQISNAGQLGVHGSKASDVHVIGNRIHDNATGNYSSGWEAGGLKFAIMTNVTLDGNEVFENHAGGLWCDIDCDGVTFSNNHIYRNHGSGITYEISRNAKIYGNIVWENASDHRSWGWGAGIRIQNSRDTEVFDNIVAWNGDGITVVSQNRDRSEWNRVVNNIVRDNKIFSVAVRSHHDFALAWLEDWNGVLTDPSSNNSGANNAYFHWNPNDAYKVFAWGEDEFRFGEIGRFNGTPGENNGQVLSSSEKDRILSGAGVPTHPSR